MIAAKQFDPVLGIDIHIIQPPGPVPPVPVPHPFIGMLIDPFDFAPIIGATVMVNGIPRAVAGTGGKNIPPHIPIGGIFVKPPGNECEVFMGSSTVLAEDEPLSFLGMPALSCHDIGMPPPPRVKKKGAPKSLFLPTSVVLAVPMGAPVLVGGPPTISMMAMGMKAVMAGAGKAFKKLRKLQKASKKMKALSDKVHKAAKKAMDKLGVPPSIQNKVHRSVCTVTGHPVDVATGKVFTEMTDFQLPGPIRFQWQRVWYSSSTYRGRLGHGWHDAFDIALTIEGRLACIRLEDGRSITCPALDVGQRYFDRRERLELVHDPAGYHLRRKDGVRYSFGHAKAGEVQPLLEITNRHGHRISFHYGPQGELERVVDAAGRALGFGYDDAQRLNAVYVRHPRDPARALALVRYQYDDLGNLVTAIDANGQPHRYAYSGRLLTTETDRNGHSFHFRYDGDQPGARCVHTWGDGGIFNHRLTYETAGITHVTDSTGATITYVCDDSGLVTAEIEQSGGTRRFEYGPDCERLAEINELGESIAFGYDDRLNCSSIEWPDGSRIQVEYNQQDLPLQLVTRSRENWRWSYDERGRVLQCADPAESITRYAYAAQGLVAKTDPYGRRFDFSYDGTGLLTSVRSDGRALATWQHDPLGRLITFVDSAGNRRERSVDACGRPVAIREEDGIEWKYEYDGRGNVTRARSTAQDVDLTYTPTGKLASRSEAGHTIRFSYDSEARLTAVRNEAGAAYEFELASNGQVAVERTFGGVTRHYTRDAAGRVVAVRHASGRITRYAYDKAGRLVRAQHSDGSEEQFTYDAEGRLLQARNREAVVTFQRDKLGRTIRESRDPHWIESEYDGRGRRVRLTSSFGASQRVHASPLGDIDRVVFSWDGIPELAWQAEWQRDEFGAETARLLPGGIRMDWRRDRLGRPTHQSVTAGGTPLLSKSYEWAAGGFLQRSESVQDGPTTFVYDAFKRLAWVDHGNGALEFRVPDAAGNIFATHDRHDCRYGEAGEIFERIGRRGSTRYEYDADGFLVRRTDPGRGASIYEWTASGRLAGVINPSGARTVFRYDALGRRISKQTNGRVTHWLWDGTRILHEWNTSPAENSAADPTPGVRQARSSTKHPDASDVTTWLFEPDSFTPMAKVKGGAAFSIITDQLGTPRLLLDSSGRERWRGTVDVRGQLARSTGDQSAMPFRFPGQYYDEETGLSYNGFRYYDPQAGLYISPDPLRLNGGLRLYAYLDQPVTRADPLGLSGDCGPGETVSLYHGSINDASKIRKNGLDPDKTPTWVSRDRQAAEDAVSNKRYDVAMGDAADPGVIESRIPKDEYDRVFAKSERDYSGFGGDIDSTEVVLREKEQVEVFNKHIVREGE